MLVNSSILHLTWSVIEDTPSSDLLTLTDTALIRLLLQQIARKILLSGEEVCALYDYIGSRMALIRDIAVQQIANGCAIAIRQARLYEVTQAQVRELKKLDRLKNEFLNTLSHELRTPITSISLAAQTLEAVLKQEGIFDRSGPRVTQLFQILHCECQREIKLINDLLTLAHLNAEVTPPIMDTINLKTWIPSTVWLFEERIRNSRQQLYILTTAELPPLTTDISDLERILIELLTNACKYTPAGEMIIVSAYATVNTIQISVSNSGVEIAADEQIRIFDAFYRIPNNDPWQHGGTGLGLALVYKLVKRLGASIQVESATGQTTFTVQFPQSDTARNGAHSSCRERVVFLPGTPARQIR
ncbi:MAG: HAMP domain-containing histidine kinase [Iphinoe sp. HA4291-MV1]|jgi:hypothetical protein|nr:HAMP domain-containing histidine kinase [Iphinoe sp. HA4291-MV1]